VVSPRRKKWRNKEIGLGEQL
jgi:hypothetical protein